MFLFSMKLTNCLPNFCLSLRLFSYKSHLIISSNERFWSTIMRTNRTPAIRRCVPSLIRSYNRTPKLCDRSYAKNYYVCVHMYVCMLCYFVFIMYKLNLWFLSSTIFEQERQRMRVKYRYFTWYYHRKPTRTYNKINSIFYIAHNMVIRNIRYVLVSRNTHVYTNKQTKMGLRCKGQQKDQYE